MNAIQLEYYRRRLIHMRRIVGQIFLVNEQTPAATSRDLLPHRNIFADDRYQRQELVQLHLELSRALARISRGKFGRCSVCQNPIQEARLRLIPYASQCHCCACEEIPAENTDQHAESTDLILRRHGEFLHSVSAIDRGEVA